MTPARGRVAFGSRGSGQRNVRVNETDLDALSALQDILDEVVNGRTEGHHCPFCGEGVLTVTVEEDVRVRLECDRCQRFFEGRLA